MRCKNYFLIAFLLFGFLLFTTKSVKACTCGPKPTVLDSFEMSQDVIIAEIIAVEKSKDDDNYPYGVKGAKMSVKKVFKGNLKEGGEVFFEQGGGANCIWTYRDEEIGAKVLIYSTPYEGRRAVSECGRSGGLSGVGDDLLYLENIDKVRGKTRISGQVRYGFFGGAPEGQSVQGKKIRVIGKNKTHTATTDKNGIYEIYDLPAGDYFIEPEVPDGWKINLYMLRYSPSLPPYYEYQEEKYPNRFPVVLENKKHISLDFMYDIDNVIQGRVLDPSGKPMKGICVTAVKAEATEFKYGPFDCTDEKGVFAITELNSKSYVLVINGDGEISATQPIKMIFHPGVKDRSKATVINIAEGKKIALPDFRVPEIVETVTLSGILTYSDGTPVRTHKVQFIADKNDETVEGEPYDYTEADGSFSLKIFKGQSGRIRAEMIFGTRHLESCPGLRNAVIETDKIPGIVTASTLWTEIKADKDSKDIKLKFAFPKCEKD